MKDYRQLRERLLNGEQNLGAAHAATAPRAEQRAAEARELAAAYVLYAPTAVNELAAHIEAVLHLHEIIGFDLASKIPPVPKVSGQ